MITDVCEKKVCCERDAEEVDHFRRGAKVLADVGKDANFLWN